MYHHGESNWTFVNGSNGKKGNITFYQLHDDPEYGGIPNKWTEIFDDGKVVNGFWIPWMTNQVIMCDNYKEADYKAYPVAGCTMYNYTKTYDINHVVHSLNMRGTAFSSDSYRVNPHPLPPLYTVDLTRVWPSGSLFLSYADEKGNVCALQCPNSNESQANSTGSLTATSHNSSRRHSNSRRRYHHCPMVVAGRGYRSATNYFHYHYLL